MHRRTPEKAVSPVKGQSQELQDSELLAKDQQIEAVAAKLDEANEFNAQWELALQGKEQEVQSLGEKLEEANKFNA